MPLRIPLLSVCMYVHIGVCGCMCVYMCDHVCDGPTTFMGIIPCFFALLRPCCSFCYKCCPVICPLRWRDSCLRAWRKCGSILMALWWFTSHLTRMCVHLLMCSVTPTGRQWSWAVSLQHRAMVISSEKYLCNCFILFLLIWLQCKIWLSCVYLLCTSGVNSVILGLFVCLLPPPLGTYSSVKCQYTVTVSDALSWQFVLSPCTYCLRHQLGAEEGRVKNYHLYHGCSHTRRSH